MPSPQPVEAPTPVATRRRLGLVVRLVGLCVFIGIFVYRLDVDDAVAALSRPGVERWIGAAAVLYLVGHTGNGLGWRGLLRSSGIHVSFVEMFRHDLSSVFWSTVLPGGVAGEVVKGVRLSSATGGGGGTIAVAILVSHLIGGTVGCLLALAMIPFTEFSPGLRQASALALGFTVLVASSVLVTIRLGPGFLRGRLPWLARRIPEGRFPSTASILRCALCALVTHSAFSVVYSLCFGAAGVYVAFPSTTVMSTLATVAAFAPISFGGFGIRELTVSGIGGVIVAPATANAAAIMVSVLWSSIVAVGGLVELGRLRGAARQAPEQAP